MKYIQKIVVLVFASLIVSSSLYAQVHNKKWSEIVEKDEGVWFASNEAKKIAENVLLYQRNIGGWQKNIQKQKTLSIEEKQHLLALKNDTHNVTTDNGATYEEMIFLSKMYRQVPDERYKKAFLAGLNYILEAQYENGGWPQFYPLKKGYYTHITYNDDSMVNILNVLDEIKNNSNYFSIKPSEEIIESVKIAFDKGIDCILKTQYKQNGVLTSWCAQHDEITFEPAKARAYELPSLSGKESAKIVLLLMRIENPSSDVKIAIHNAVKWFEAVKINGLREERFYDEKGKIIDKKMIPDENAKPLWARFMELDDNTPFFCDRDGIKKATLVEIGSERRNGYAWYTNEPKEVFKKYARWEKKYGNKNIEVSVVKKKTINEYNVVVAKDGSGDYSTIQEALNNTKSFPYERVIINIRNGVYNEKIHVYSWNTKVSFLGESKDHTIITYNDFFGKINKGRNSTFHSSTVLVEGNDFIAKNLTIKNTAGEVGQAVALSVNSTRAVFENCAFLGFQDTLYTTGDGFKQYFKDCYIEGSTDFIFGEATALFEGCTIHSKADSFITAASTPENQNYGYVFRNCKLTADENVTKVYLGRPWRKYAKTVFINCDMGKHILPKGWHNWNKKEAEEKVFYAEFNSIGQGANTEKRVSWSNELKKNQVKKYTHENIFDEVKSETKLSWYSNIK